MGNKHKYLMGETVVIRVPREVKAKVLEYARAIDRDVWAEGCVFTLGPLHRHRDNVKKQLRRR